jgi:hypothetical protein
MSTRSWLSFLGLAVAAAALQHACTPGFQDDDDDVDEVRVEPSAIDFGEVPLNVSKIETFKVYNDTAGTVTLETIRIDPEGSTFTIAGAPDDGYPLEAGSDKLINVEYYPTAEDQDQASVLVVTDHTDYTELSVSLVGCSMAEGCEDVTPGDDDDDDTADDDDDDDDTADDCGTIDLDPTSINFGSVDVGDTAYETISIQNDGTATLEITGLSVSNNVFGHQGMTLPAEIPAGGGTQIQAMFSPTASGAQSGYLVIESCDPAQPAIQVALQGTGNETCDPNCLPDIEVSPTNLDFGDLSGNPGSVSFTVTNSGVDPLTLSGITATASMAGGSVSIVSGDPLATIEPGITEYYILEWDPGELFPGMGCMDFLDAGSSFVTISSDDPDEPNVLLTMTGCCDGTGQGMCQMVGIFDVMMCLSSCPDLVQGALYCIVLGQDSC